MSELTTCIQAVSGLMSQSETTNPKELRKRIVRLYEEGIDTKTLIAALIARGHEKEEELILSGGSLDSLPLTISDLTAVERTLGINDITPENRAAWEKKFREGRALYWCPECGYAGNGEFNKGGVFGPSFMFCYQCNYVAADPRYFTRSWTPEEQAAFEAEIQARRAAVDAKRVADAELKSKRATQQAAIRSEAVKAARVIDEYQWTLSGEDPEDYEYVELESAIRTVMNLMSRPTAVGQLPVPADDLVTYFKSNLKPTDDLEMSQQEFNRCAREYDAMSMEDTNHE